MTATRSSIGRFDGKVALVVGASVGIGAAAARLFADLGAAVVLASRNRAAIDAIVGEIERSGGRAAAVTADVASQADLDAAVALAVERFGGLDVAFNNAGTQGPAAPSAEQSEADYDSILDVNLKGVWRAMRAEIPAMRARGGGAIVNNASVGGLIAAPGISPYCASKHGVIGLSKSAALDYAPDIRINVVAPGAIDTDMFNDWMADPAARQRMVDLHPLGRIGLSEEVATVAAFLCSDAAAFMTGAVLPVDGGYTTL